MKISKLFIYGLLILSLLLPYAAFAYAAEKPKYVGVNEGQEIIWKTEFDKGPIEKYYEDAFPGFSDETYEKGADDWFDLYEWNDDAVKWRVIILEIDDEDDDDYDGWYLDEDDVEYVKLKIAIYEQEEDEDWDDIDKNEKYIIYEDEAKVYANIIYEGLWDDGMGLTSLDSYDAPEWPAFFVAKNLDYDDVVDELDEEIEDNYDDEEYSVSTVKVDYFFQKKEVGISTTVESTNKEVEDFDSVIKFNDDGIMYYYEYMYDGDTIAKFELDTIGGVYLIENWWWITLVAAAAVVIIIIIVIVIKKKR